MAQVALMGSRCQACVMSDGRLPAASSLQAVSWQRPGEPSFHGKMPSLFANGPFMTEAFASVM